MTIRPKMLLVYFVGLIINLTGYLLSGVGTNINIYINALVVIICFSYLWSLYVFSKEKGLMSLTTLFWICLGIFSVSRLFLYIIGACDFMNYTYSIMSSFHWEDSTAVTVLNYYYIFMMIFSLVMLMSNNTVSLKNSYEKIQEFNALTPLGKVFPVIFYISAPVAAFEYVAKVFLVRSIGYASIYNGELNANYSLSPIFTIVRATFTVTFYFIIAMGVEEKKYNRYALIYIIVNAIPLLQGSRARFITVLLTILFLRYLMYGKTPKMRTVLLVAIIGIPVLDFISSARVNGVSNWSLLGSYRDFFIGLSGSLNVPAYYIQNKSNLSENTYPFIFDPIVRLFQYLSNRTLFTGGQSIALLDVRANLGHWLTYNISSNYYLSGYNIGSNFIAEMSEFGYFGVVIFSYVVSKLIQFVENNMMKNLWLRFMSIELCSWIFFLPRAEAFYDTYNLTKYTIIFLVVYIVGMMTKSGNRVAIKEIR